METGPSEQTKAGDFDRVVTALTAQYSNIHAFLLHRLTVRNQLLLTTAALGLALVGLNAGKYSLPPFWSEVVMYLLAVLIAATIIFSILTSIEMYLAKRLMKEVIAALNQRCEDDLFFWDASWKTLFCGPCSAPDWMCTKSKPPS